MRSLICRKTNCSSHILKKEGLLLLVGASLWACSGPVTLAETYSCAGKKNAVAHFVQMVTKDGKVEKFNYSSSTPVSGSVNNCSIDSNGAMVTDLLNGERAFVLPGSEVVVVVKSGNQFKFDFSKISVGDFCGQSSTMARHLTITPGINRCSAIDNF